MGWVNKDSSIVRKYSNGGKTPEKEGSEKTSKLSDMAKKGAIGAATIVAPVTVGTSAILRYLKNHVYDKAIKKYSSKAVSKVMPMMKKPRSK